jgi:hypothetical protein
LTLIKKEKPPHTPPLIQLENLQWKDMAKTFGFANYMLCKVTNPKEKNYGDFP